MNIYITTGTYDFLKQIQEKNPNEQMFLMQNAEHALLLHETEKKTIFSSPRKYEVVASNGNFQQAVFLLFSHITVTDEGKPVFEFNLKEKQSTIEKQQGYTTFRLLRPLKGDTYIMITGWKDDQSYKQWKNSTASKLIDDLNSKTTIPVLSSPSYTKLYVIPKNE